MILTDKAEAEANIAAGLWGRVPLDMVLRKNAVAVPDDIALRDAPDRQHWNGSAPEVISYRQLERRTQALAVFMTSLGLKADDPVIIQLPNSVDFYCALFGCFRAGLMAVPAALNMRGRSLRDLIDTSGAKAIITCARVENDAPALRARDAAAEMFNIRFVFGFGPDLPDGLVPLDDIARQGDLAAMEAPVERKELPADHVATLSPFYTADGQLELVPRSHNQWISTGVQHLLEARLDEKVHMFSAMHPGLMGGFGPVLIPWLLSSGRLDLHHFSSRANLLGRLRDTDASHLVVPAALSGTLEANDEDEKGLSLVWPGRHDLTYATPSGYRITDVTVLSEWTFVASTRPENTYETPAPLPIGDVTGTRSSDMPPLLQMSLVPLAPGSKTVSLGRGDAEFCCAGPAVPKGVFNRSGALDAATQTDDGFIKTGVGCSLVTVEDDTAHPTGLLSGDFVVGRAPIHASLCEEAIADHFSLKDAALFSEHDPMMGDRLHLAVVLKPGCEFDEQELRDHIERIALDAHTVPSSIRAIRSIPRTDDGTIVRAALARQFAG